MFFIISKIVEAIFGPLNFLVFLSVAGICLWHLKVKIGRALASFGVFALAICCFSPLGGLLLRPLEDRFPQPPKEMPAPYGIIVLGGALDSQLTEARGGQPSLITGAARLTAAVELARQFPQARLIFTGGSGDLLRQTDGEARAVHALWLSLGVPESQMSFESASRNTWENALFTKDLVDPKPDQRWLLVTSAWHIPRSMGIFRHVGFNVTAYPVDYLTFGDYRDFETTTVSLDELTMLNFAFHEWLGLVVYRLTDKTNALFPKPEFEKAGE